MAFNNVKGNVLESVKGESVPQPMIATQTFTATKAFVQSFCNK